MSATSIETTPRPYCPVCLGEGFLLYEKLRDRLFDTPGEWTMKQCKNSSCTTLWLDPTPTPEETYKLYETYSTHSSPTYIPPKKTLVRNLLERVRVGYLARVYGYKEHAFSFSNYLLSFLVYLHPAWKDAQEVNTIFYTPKKEGGLFLDVGCGSGNAIETMARMGWRGIGTDVDEKAINNAKSKNLEVYLGELSALQFPDEHVDAILLSHVIEHVPNPKELLRECWRILKVGGTIVLITPNSTSRGRAWYKRNWRGLETPQHLQIFSVDSLQSITQQAGFTGAKGFSSLQGASYILQSSHNLKHYNEAHQETKRTLTRRILEQLALFILGWIHVFFPKSDEIAIVFARK